MHVVEVDGLPVRLRSPHDLSFLARWGRVFRVLDEQDSGNLCFGVEGAQGRVFVKYAGAATLRYDAAIADAVARSRIAADVYRDLAHPTLVHLREAVETDAGHALVFTWTDAVPLGRQYGRAGAASELSIAQRIDAVQQIYDFHVHAAAWGWIAVDLYDGSVLIDPSSARVTLCDIDYYRPGRFVNEMGRMWGSTRFMSPEEYELGTVIDEVTNVFALGALAHTLLGDDATKARGAWAGSAGHFDVARRAMEARREDRWPSVAVLADAWRALPSD